MENARYTFTVLLDAYRTVNSDFEVKGIKLYQTSKLFPVWLALFA